MVCYVELKREVEGDHGGGCSGGNTRGRVEP